VPQARNAIRSARERIALVADDGSFEAWDADLVSSDPLGFSDVKPYRERLAEAHARTGEREAVVCGQATLEGRPLVVIASEFGFLGGSIGTATGDRVARALERARGSRLPVVALTASGGTRMQEGTLALLQMAKLAAGVRRLRDDGLPYLVYLMHPTMGGVLAAWASLCTLLLAEPGAVLGFAGPRVVELLQGERLPEGVQTAEHLLERGLVDGVVPHRELRGTLASVLRAAADRPPPVQSRSSAQPRAARPTARRPQSEPGRRRDAWGSLLRARDPARPAARELLEAWAEDLTPVRGDGVGRGDDPSCLAAVARVFGVPAVVVAQHRDLRAHGPARMGPAGYRKARRAIVLAHDLDLPLLTIVDTPGAELSRAAEEGGLSMEIARCLSELSRVRAPTLAVLLGEGGSGGALALLACDRVVCAEHASLAAIAPEGASAILYRNVERAPELAATQGGASWELERFGIVDVVVPERPSAEREPEAFVARLGATVEVELRALVAEDREFRLTTRERRYRAIANPGST
jgi:acetyl-CoA carboxylase carboxyl transferase subunit beta